MTKHRSSIPPAAKERVVERFAGGAKKRAEYRANRQVVGVRHFHPTGEPDFEYALKDGRRHGVQYRWDEPGVLVSAEPWVDGVPHGVARQWHEGRLIGTYHMTRGTGLDLWRDVREDGSVYVSEIIYLKDGRPHGFEWWVEEDQRRVYIERHWRAGDLHGIEREWNDRGRLRRGYPKYHVAGRAVTKRQYLRAAERDRTLPPFEAKANRPGRVFPAEVARHLAR